MQRFYRKIVNHPRIILTVFILAALCGAVTQGMVAVNYDMNDYLPPDSDSTRALELLGKHLGIFADKVKAEVSGPDGGPVQSSMTLDISGMGPAEIAELARSAFRGE